MPATTIPNLLYRTQDQRFLASRITDKITQINLLHLFSSSETIDHRITIITQWLFGPVTSSSIYAQNTQICISEQHIRIVAELIYHLIELTYRAKCSIPFICQSIKLVLDTHFTVSFNPQTDMQIDLQYFKRALFSILIPEQSDLLTTQETIAANGFMLYEFMLSNYFQYYHLYKHVFASRNCRVTEILCPFNSTSTSSTDLV